MRKMLILLVLVCLVLPAAAQEEDCPPEALRAWLDVQSDTLDALMALDAQANETFSLDLVLQMQTIRREFAQEDVPPCALEAALHSNLLFANVIDYWIAVHAGEQPLADKIAAENGPMLARTEDAIEALESRLTTGGAFGGAPASARGGRIVIWDDEEYFTALSGIAFVNDIDLVFASDDVDEETLALLDDPDVGAAVVNYMACQEDTMDTVIPRLASFVENGGHLLIFYDGNWMDCNPLLRKHLGVTLVEDYEWRKQTFPEGTLPSWLAGMNLTGVDTAYWSHYLMARQEGEAGYIPEGDEERLVVITYPYEGGYVTMFPRFSSGPLLEDRYIDRGQNEEVALRMLKFLAGEPLPPPKEVEAEN